MFVIIPYFLKKAKAKRVSTGPLMATLSGSGWFLGPAICPVKMDLNIWKN
jgi:hypothetical protein